MCYIKIEALQCDVLRNSGFSKVIKLVSKHIDKKAIIEQTIAELVKPTKVDHLLLKDILSYVELNRETYHDERLHMYLCI